MENLLRVGTFLFLVSWPGWACGQPEFPLVEVASVIEAQVHSGHRVVGTVTPLRTSTIGSAADGRVAEFLVDIGQAIRAGQPLARLRTATLQIELSAAQAELELYRQELAELENGSRAEDVAEAEANALAAKAAMENAAAQLRRQQALADSRAATDADLEDARERAQATKYSHAAAEAALQRVKRGPRAEQIAQARARFELQQQNLRLIEDRIEKHTIVAPYDGFVSMEYTEVGAWISRGDPIAQVIQLDEVEIQAPVTADYATKLRRGDTIRVEFPELPTKLLTGTIDRIVPVAESRARTFPVYIRLENEIRHGAPLLMAGMLARIDLPAGTQRTMPLVPKDALVLNETERAVFVVELPAGSPSSSNELSGEEPLVGTVRKIPVELGVALGSRIQVRGQLSAGQQVVVVGNERLAPNTQVTIARQRAEEVPEG